MCVNAELEYKTASARRYPDEFMDALLGGHKFIPMSGYCRAQCAKAHDGTGMEKLVCGGL